MADKDKAAQNHKPSTPVGAAKPASTSVANAGARSAKNPHTRNPETEVSADEAVRAADSMRPNVGTPAPNPAPRPATSSQGGGRLEDLETDESLQEEREFSATQNKSRIKVQATQMGYFDHLRRRPGDVFTIPAKRLEADVRAIDPTTGMATGRVMRQKGEIEAFSHRWMRRVASDTPLVVTTVAQSLKQIHDDQLATKMDRSARTTGGEQDEVNQNPAAKGTGDQDVI